MKNRSFLGRMTAVFSRGFMCITAMTVSVFLPLYNKAILLYHFQESCSARGHLGVESLILDDLMQLQSSSAKNVIISEI